MQFKPLTCVSLHSRLEIFTHQSQTSGLKHLQKQTDFTNRMGMIAVSLEFLLWAIYPFQKHPGKWFLFLHFRQILILELCIDPCLYIFIGNLNNLAWKVYCPKRLCHLFVSQTENRENIFINGVSEFEYISMSKFKRSDMRSELNFIHWTNFTFILILLACWLNTTLEYSLCTSAPV